MRAKRQEHLNSLHLEVRVSDMSVRMYIQTRHDLNDGWLMGENEVM